MRIGLLECDHVRERHLPIAGDYADMFTAMIALADPAAEVVLYDARTGVLPQRPEECDGWLLTGSSASVYDDEPWIAPVVHGDEFDRKSVESALCVDLAYGCFGAKDCLPAKPGVRPGQWRRDSEVNLARIALRGTRF
jgi:hypothetical protein